MVERRYALVISGLMQKECRAMSATIYRFPVGGRAGLANQREQTKPAASAAPASVPAAITACGSAWYHEEAMREADRTRKS